MPRIALSLSVPALAVTLVLLVLSAAPDAVPSRYAHADCRRLELEAPGEGRLVGIEDIVVDASRRRLILSAQDRRRGDGGVHGLFTLALRDLREAGPAPAWRLEGVEDRAPYPHGIAIDGAGDRLAYIARPAGRYAGPTRVAWGRLDGRGGFEAEGETESAALCRANDLAFRDDELWLTLDRRACGFSPDDFLPVLRTGRVARVGAEGLDQTVDAFAFANGIVDTPHGMIVAETRGDALRILGREAVLPVPGGPDNLNAVSGDAVLTALHPNTLRLALYMWGLLPDAPSRIAEVDLARERVEVLYDDPDGALLSGATAAVEAAGLLVAGSAFDSGLLVCGGDG